MRSILLMACCIFSIRAAAQKTETYYDYNWRPCESLKARFYSTLEKTDSGWLRHDYFLSGLKPQMKALFADSACKIYNGECIFLYANGSVSSIGRQIENKNEGVCVSYHANGMMSDSATYHNGRAVGNKMGWWPNGMTSDSTAHVNDSMDVDISWFDNGSISSAGYRLRGKMHGKWNFYHSNGHAAAVEAYQNGKLLSADYYQEDGSALTDTSKANTSAIFKGGLTGWQKYLTGKLFWPSGYQFSNGDMAVAVVDITINEDGKMENVEVSTPFHPAFDKIALDVVRRSPAWSPRISHNRRVKARFRQPVTFRQEE
ncbi:MAG: TonB family protein [Chitinophagaceae bacterium]